MFNINTDYTMKDLDFNYLNLKKYLFKMYEQGIQDINIFLLISLEKDYYEGENLKKILADLIKLSNDLTLNIDGKNIKFKVNKISLDVGDVLNRHRWIYRYNEKYMLEHNLKDDEEDKIPEDIKKEIEAKAYETGKQQGFDWFKNHAVDAINLVLSENNKLKTDFKLTDGITEIFKGNEAIPPIEYICYEYWLKHSKYKTVEKALNEVRNLPDSVVERTYDHEVKYYMERLEKRGETEEISKFPEMFKKYSKDYLVDETIIDIITYKTVNNLQFSYYTKAPMHDVVYTGKKIKNNISSTKYQNYQLINTNKLNRITIRKKI
jgi:hypothetical protein